MGLKGLHLKHRYSTEEDNLLNDFFIPCLKNSYRYDRISGFYTSKVLLYLLEGLREFLLKEGSEIRLILGLIPKCDYEIVSKSEEELLGIFSKEFVDQLYHDAISADQNCIVVQILAWCLYHKKMKFKIGIMLNSRGDTANQEEINENLSKGMLHEKIGIFYDEDGEKVSFSGSNNETPYGLLHHGEKFDVFKSWKPLSGDRVNVHLKDDVSEFEKLWKNEGRRIKVFSLPNEKLDELFIKLLPEKVREENFDQAILMLYQKLEAEINKNDGSSYMFPKLEKVQWYSPQRDGYNSWIEKNKKGVLKIATGVGKTLLAIKCISTFIQDQYKLGNSAIITIALPDGLMLQWKEELENWLIDTNNEIPWIFTVFSGTKGTINQQINDFKDAFVMLSGKNSSPTRNTLILMAYYDSFGNKIIPVLNELIKDNEVFFIADEVHELGSKTRRSKFQNFVPKYKLGLSATPRRYFDTIGTKFILDYFENGIIFEYLISKAIKEELLCNYHYIPIFCELNEEELGRIRKINQAILALRANIEKEKNPRTKSVLEQSIEQKYFSRARVIKKAESKVNIVIDLVLDLKRRRILNYCLVYTEDHDQLGRIYNSLIDKDISISKITEKILVKKRSEIVELLKEKIKSVVVAEKILDQGINIPRLEYAIIMSSTGNERQYIQRRGRLLRIAKGKEYATIFDLVIKGIDSEITRISNFFEDCDNQQDVLQILKESNIVLK